MSGRWVLVVVLLVAVAAVAGYTGYQVYQNSLPEVRIVWDRSSPTDTTGTITNLTGRTFQSVKISLADPRHVSHRGFTVGPSDDRLYVIWDERVVDSKEVPQPDGGVMTSTQTEFVTEKTLSPGTGAPFQLNEGRLAFPVIDLRVEDGGRVLRVDQALPGEPQGPW